MEILVCVKRVPASGARVPLTDDGQAIDTRHLGFTIGPHEECAVEEAVRLVAAHGGSVTVLTVGPPDAAEQLRYALSMGADRGVLVDTGQAELDPEAAAAAIVHGVVDEPPFDLVLFGDSSADAGHFQVGVRVACARGLPIVGGIKGIAFDGSAAPCHDDGTAEGTGESDREGNGCGSEEVEPAEDEGEYGAVELLREVADGVEVYRVPLPAAAAVKEGLNLPRYPNLPGRLRAKKAPLRVVAYEPPRGGLRTLGLRQPVDDRAEAVQLGSGAAAASAVVDVLEELGRV